MDQFPKVLSMGDVMRILGVSRTRIEDFVERGLLHPQDTSAGKIFLEAEVQTFKAERRKRAKKDSRIKGGR